MFDDIPTRVAQLRRERDELVAIVSEQRLALDELRAEYRALLAELAKIRETFAEVRALALYRRDLIDAVKALRDPTQALQ